MTGDTGAAEDAFRQELRLSRGGVAPRFACDGLLGLAGLAILRDAPDRSARLAGAAAAHREDAPRDELEQRIDASFLDPARARHGSGTWDAAARAGGAMSLDDAIPYALRETRP